MAVFSRIGYTRTEARSRLFDVMWAHDYPFGGDLKEMLQTLEPHQKVRMHLPSPLPYHPYPYPPKRARYSSILFGCPIISCLLNIAIFGLISCYLTKGEFFLDFWLTNT